MDPNEQLARIRELCEQLTDGSTKGQAHVFIPAAFELADRVRDLDHHLSNNGSFPDEWDSNGVQAKSSAEAYDLVTRAADPKDAGAKEETAGVAAKWFDDRTGWRD